MYSGVEVFPAYTLILFMCFVFAGLLGWWAQGFEVTSPSLTSLSYFLSGLPVAGAVLAILAQTKSLRGFRTIFLGGQCAGVPVHLALGVRVRLACRGTRQFKPSAGLCTARELSGARGVLCRVL